MDAQAEYLKWLSSEILSDREKEELRNLGENEIGEYFSRNLEFGTGGLRGIMRPGTNSMNIYTVRKATQGLADEILSESSDNAQRGVVIAYDSRNHSRDFAEAVSCVLCGNHIKVFLFDSLRPTPELSFAVRHLKCCRGIVITASHNPKEYNGYKVYGEDGAQVLPEQAEKILCRINNVDIFDGVRTTADPEITVIGKEVDDAYIAAVKAESTGFRIPEDMRIVYTPLHGSGYVPVMRIMQEIGVKNIFVPEQQREPDGDFPTVKSPNPEESPAFEMAIEYAESLGNIDLILGTDPDSDRVGIAVRNSKGRFVTLNGNQTAAILCDFILRNMKKTEKPRIVKTIVTTEMVSAIADKYGVQTVNVPTGFKYIGEKIRQFEKNGEQFIFGCEESYGYLKGSYARDKDAVVASMLICEAAAECRASGTTLYERLQSLYGQYGYYKEKLISYTLSDIEVKRIMDRLAETENISCPYENVFQLNGLTIRPSGTEPKIKFYCSARADTEPESEKAIEEQTKKVLEIVKY